MPFLKGHTYNEDCGYNKGCLCQCICSIVYNSEIGYLVFRLDGSIPPVEKGDCIPVKRFMVESTIIKGTRGVNHPGLANPNKTSEDVESCLKVESA